MGELKASLEIWIAGKMPQATNVSISEPEKPGMGLSSETILFDIQWEESGKEKSRPVVLRGAPQEKGVFPEYELAHQFRIMQILKDTDIPVANMIWLEEDASDADDDDDHDGFKNRDEHRAGTHPGDPDSLLEITNVRWVQTTEGHELRWPSVANHEYSVFRSTNLLAGFDLLSNGLSATPPTNSFTDASGLDDASFYRVGVE